MIGSGEMATTRDRLPAADASGAAGNGHSDAGAGEHARSPWVGIDPQVDPVRWARLLRRAHELALSQGRPPSILRDVVARSWTRAAQAGSTPTDPPPRCSTHPRPPTRWPSTRFRI